MAARSTSPNASGAPRLLVVDDEPIFREEFSSLLSDDGYSVDSAASVDDALTLLGHRRFDVLLCDNKMPKRAGEELVNEVQKRWPSMFVVNVTGQPTERAARTMMERGGFYFVPKPFRFEDIQRTLLEIRLELDLHARIAPPTSILDLCEGLAGEGFHVGALLSDAEVKVPRLSVLEWDPTRLASATPAARTFATGAEHPAVLLVLSQTMFDQHGRAVLLGAARELRKQLEGLAPLVIGFPANQFSHLDVLVLRESLAYPEEFFGGHGAIGHQRRAIVRSLAAGAKTREELRSQLEPDASHGGTFYLDNLQTHGIVRFDGQMYRLTSHGEKVASAIAQMDSSPWKAPDGSRLFTVPA